MMNQSNHISTKIVPVSLATQCSQRIDVYENLEHCNPTNKRKKSIVFDDKITRMEDKKN